MRNSSRFRRAGVGIGVAALMIVTTLAQPAGARMLLFSNGDTAIGTEVDANGDRTVCSDGFELIAARIGFDANGDIPSIGDPTGFAAGTIDQSGLFSVYSADLVDNFGNDEPLTTAVTGGPPGAYIFIGPDGQPAADLYGFAQVDMVNAAEFYEFDGLTRPVRADGTAMFVPTSPLPVGEDVVIVPRDFDGFRSNNRRVTVIDCSEPPVAVEVEADIFNNKIRPDKPWQRVRGAIINNGTFDIGSVDNLEVAGATPFRIRVRDVDHDGDLDLRFVARNRHTDIECGDTELTITGTIDGEPFQTTVDISTKCKNNKW